MPQSECLGKLITETNNPQTQHIDELDTLSMITLINEQDYFVLDAIKKELPNIAIAVDKITESFNNKGRLFYFGAGTSGRLGVLDASECPPTFGTDKEMVQGFIAGGDFALRNPVEGAEDSFEDGQEIVKSININENDVVVGIAASGRTKYVLGAIEMAKSLGAYTVGVCNNPNTLLHQACDITIAPVCGAEVIQGSTRMKSGTAQKLVLNMLTTASMVKIGKVYKNYMVDMSPCNEKLIDRAIRLVIEITGADYETAENALKLCGYHVKTAIVMILNDCDYETAVKKLQQAGGFVKKALN
ncbi:MAG: N-acetylmuramic acid 6-phosphate etherase [Oscillospiraceae bacterium]